MAYLIKVDLIDGGSAFLNPDFIVGVTFKNFNAYIAMSHPIGYVGKTGNVGLVSFAEFERIKPLLTGISDHAKEE